MEPSRATAWPHSLEQLQESGDREASQQNRSAAPEDEVKSGTHAPSQGLRSWCQGHLLMVISAFTNPRYVRLARAPIKGPTITPSGTPLKIAMYVHPPLRKTT